MAEKLCELKKKGGGGAKYTETSLWTNSAPTSSFSPQTITLSDDINNYEYIGVKFNTDTTGITPSTAIMSVTDYKKGVNTGTSGRRDVLSIASQIATEGSYYSRRVSYVSDTSANISAAKLYGSSTTSNTDVIPIQVVGIKKGGSGTKAKTVHGTGTMSTSTTTKVTLNFRPDFVVLECTKGTAEVRLVYDSAYGSSIQRLCAIASGGTASYVKDSYPPTSTVGTRVSLIENDGFTISKLSQGNYDNYGADFSYIAGKYEV